MDNNFSLKSVYNNYYNHKFSKLREPYLDAKTLKIITEIGVGREVLDIGCSSGYTGYFLVKNNNNYYGIDFIKTAINQAKGLGLSNTYVCDIEHERWPSAIIRRKYDYIILSEIIEHLIDPITIIERAKLLLKKDGKIIICTPNIAYIQYRLELLVGRLPDFCEFRKIHYERPYNFQHKTFFTKKVLLETIKLSGLMVEVDASHSGCKNKLESKFVFMEKILPNLFIKNFFIVAKKS